MEITEFLLARIAEDEAVAREVLEYRAENLAPQYLGEPDHGFSPNVDVMGPDVRVGVDRVLAECEAKRRIVEYLDDYGRGVTDGAANRLLGDLALPYAGHPDYREEWKPEDATSTAE